MSFTFDWVVCRSLLAEGLITAIFSFSVYSVVTGSSIINSTDAQASVALTVGFSSVALIYAFMDVTIAHFNPAITLGAILTGKLPIWMGLGYMIMQCCGAMLASGTMLLCKPGTSLSLLNTTRGVVFPAATQGNALLTEMVLTGILTYVAFAVAINVFNPPTQVKVEVPDEGAANDKLRIITSQAPNRSAFAPIAIGLTLGFLSLLGLGSSGGVFNPAVTLAPVLFSGRWYNVWVYWVGQFVGGIVGAFLHVIIFSRRI